jgi:hypothetical protein
MQTTLSESIRRDLSGRIGAGLGPPTELTLPAPARHYGVGFTPVRAAVRDLVSQGVPLKQGNGRLRVNPSPAHHDDVGPLETPARLIAWDGLEERLAAEVVVRSLEGG